MLEQQVKNTLGELAFQLCVANSRIEELTKQLEEKKEKNETNPS